MSLDADILIDRRRMQRRVFFWRALAFIAAVVLLISLAGLLRPAGIVFSPRQDHIARLSIDGIIVPDRDRLELIERIGRSDTVKGVIVHIDSPGGSTTGGEDLYTALRRLSERKPMVAEIGALGTSAGYMAALAADHIIARHTSITGSIGVLFQYANAQRLLDTLGVEFDAIKSSPMKAEPNFYEPLSERGRHMIAEVVNESYDWFVGIVAERRDMSIPDVQRIANGAVYTGEQAMRNGLIDTLGDERAARLYLVRAFDLDEDLQIRTWDETLRFGGRFGADLMTAWGAGFAHGAVRTLKNVLDDLDGSPRFDGLRSLWRVSAPRGAHAMGGEK